MSIPKILAVIALFSMISCDKEELNDEAISLLKGHWHVWDFEPSADSPVDASLLAKAAILDLVERGCDPVEFDFREDRNVKYTNGMRYLNASSNDDGVDVDCAPEYDNRYGKYKFDYEKLVLEYENDEVLRMEAVIEGTRLVTDVEDLIINGVEVSGKLIFIREVDHD